MTSPKNVICVFLSLDQLSLMSGNGIRAIFIVGLKHLHFRNRYIRPPTPNGLRALLKFSSFVSCLPFDLYNNVIEKLIVE
jgi:hypothetical protein